MMETVERVHRGEDPVGYQRDPNHPIIDTNVDEGVAQLQRERTNFAPRAVRAPRCFVGNEAWLTRLAPSVILAPLHGNPRPFPEGRPTTPTPVALRHFHSTGESSRHRHTLSPTPAWICPRTLPAGGGPAWESVLGWVIGQSSLARAVRVHHLGLTVPVTLQVERDAACVSVQVKHSRRLIFQVAEVSVPRRLFEGVLDRIGRLSPAPS